MTVLASLDTLARIRAGYVPSAADGQQRKAHDRTALGLETQAGASAPGLLPSAVGLDGVIDWGALVETRPVRATERYRIHEGDLLLPLRSQRLQAVVARGVPPGVLAAGHWAILAPDPAHLDVDYLAWYLNHPRTRARLAATMVGTSLQFLTVATVRAFEVELPPLPRQRQIARAAVLTARVGELERRLAAARHRLTDAVAMAAVEHTRAPASAGAAGRPSLRRTA